MQGYLKIRVEGYSPERFLNLCSNHGILIWDLVNHGNSYEMYMSIRGFRQLKPIIKKTKTKIKILGRYGMPFFLHKYRKRKMFFIGIFLSCCILYLLSLFIWDIQIEGNYSKTTDVLMDFLESKSIIHGISKNDVDCERIETMIRNEFNDIIWASVEMKGTRLIVHVQESTDVEAAKAEEEQTPTDICAEKDGIVTEIITRKGTPLVVPGTVVKAGDILVQGRVDIINDNGEVGAYQYCKADADILIKSIYNYTDSFSLNYIKKEYTGEEKKEFYLKFFAQKLYIPGMKNKFKHYDTISEERQLELWDNFYLPFYVGKVKKEEYKNVEKVYTKEEAEQLAAERLNEFCENLRKKGVQILENNVKIQVDEANCTALGKIQVIEKTGTSKPTEILEIKQTQEEQNIDEHN